tara:strand:+ start:21166 stop:21672 length:507 start_codon:yes stop_codon:yes gene_type:complete
MAAQVESGFGSVVELGAGTGVLTQALLAKGIAANRLCLIEKSPAMAGLLKQRFPHVRVLQDDASRLRQLISLHGIDQPVTLVSSLPLLSLPRRQRLRVLSEMAAILPEGGRLIQFTYSPQPPLALPLTTTLGLKGQRTSWVIMNLPPAAVWVYTKQSQVIHNVEEHAA